jgi:signal transduction histidine kinase
VRRSIGLPLGLGIALAVLVLGLAVGWQILVVVDPRPATPGLTTADWVLLVLGAVLFALLMAGLVWLSVWLIREMRLNQRQTAFLDAVTHEMKTPLASIRLYLDTLSRHDPEPARRSHFLSLVREDLDRLDHTVDQVLAAARAEEPGRRLPSGRVALAEVLGSCIREIRERYALPEKAVALDVDPATKVRGDATELGVVFRNLLENAVKYSSEPVEVRVRVRRRAEDRIDVDISDRGIGIPARELRKIFRRFYRVGRDMQRTASGLGLGLFIVRNLVRRQGGKVVARSDGDGEGSRFVVTLREAPRVG